jgi:SAM-dependent methyltransferase
MEHISEKQLSHYYKDKQHIVPAYQLDQFAQLKKLDNMYKDVKSNIQFRTIIKHSNNFNFIHIKHKLIDLLCKHISIKNAYDTVYRLISLPLTDSCIYKIMGSIMKAEERAKDQSYTNVIGRREKKVELFKFTLLDHIKARKLKVTKYLDFGCGDCGITAKYGKALNLQKENIFGADIASWGNYNDKTRKILDMTFVQVYDGKPYDFPDNSISVISCFMVLHHVKNLDFCLKELHRIMAPNGLLYITEHMVTNFMEKMVVDIEHSIYEIAIRNNNNYHKDFVNNYYHCIEWNLIMDRAGFKYIDHDYLKYDIMDQDDPTKKAWILYERV